MKLYRMLIKPQISYPDRNCHPVCLDLEHDEKWYAEEEKEAVKEKYKDLESTFQKIVFDVKYEPVQLPSVDAVPVVHARWKDNGNGTVSCNRCWTWFQKDREPYLLFCGYCGAKMDGKEK